MVIKKKPLASLQVTTVLINVMKDNDFPSLQCSEGLPEELADRYYGCNWSSESSFLNISLGGRICSGENPRSVVCTFQSACSQENCNRDGAERIEPDLHPTAWELVNLILDKP